MGMTVGERIKKATKARGMTVDELAAVTGYSRSNIYDIFRGDHQPKALHKFAGALKASLQYLESGRGEMFGPSAEEGPSIKGQVPLISWVQAGNWNDASDPYAVGDAEDWLACPAKHGPRTYCLRVRGPSMYNPGGRYSYQEGSIIFVDPDRRAEHGDRVIVRLEDSAETTFKQLIEEGGELYLRALNPSWPEPIIKINSHATICGVVIGQWAQ